MVDDVTIVVTQWQHFSETARALESLYAFTPSPLRLIYVDGNSPPDIRRYLELQAQQRGFTLIRSERYLTSSEARNLAMPYVETKYAAFLDNSAIVTQGWVQALHGCAEETGAWVVEPLYCYGDAENPLVYSFAPELRVVESDGKRRVEESAPLYRMKLADVRATLRRKRAGYAKFHCALIRRDVIVQLGAFDEAYTNYQDHRDFGLAVQHAGGSLYCEPDAIVLLIEEPRLRRTDWPLFLLRWSNAWLQPSIRHFARVWSVEVDDDGLQGGTRFRNVQRYHLLSSVRTIARRIGGWRAATVVERLINAFFDRIVEPVFVAPLERRRLSAPRRNPAIEERNG